MKNSKNSIPEDVYVGYIRSLFQDVGVLPLGALCYALIAVLLYYKTGQVAQLLLGPLMLVAGIWRYFKITRVDHALISDYASALAWERRYLWWGSMHGVVVGAFGFVSIFWGNDSFAELAAVSAILCGTITIAGRNYGSRKMVSVLTLTIVFPIALALMMKGDIYHFILGMFIAPFMLVVMKMAELVRTVLFTAISEEKRSTRLAQRFDRALNTMPHGLLMLNNEERVVVSNAQAAEMLGFRSSEQMLGRTLKSLLMRGVASGLLSQRDYAYAEEHLSKALREGRDRKVLLSMTNGRHFEFAAREGHDEVGVLTFEEVTSRVEAEEKIRFMARYDSLTSLPNRAYFHEKVTEAMAAGDQDRLCGLAVLDLDDFKSVNDTLGHPVGDGLIYAMAERLSAFGSDNVRISRFGGDEFMIFFNQVDSEAAFSAQFDEIFGALRGEVDVAGHAMRLQASGGAVVVSVRDGDVDSMIVKADLALYKAKELGKNGWRLFETEMDVAFRNRQIMKADLRSAIEARNLRVVYQPIVDARTMRIASCEALCRWDHPELGLVSPSVFIPLAEEMGLISEISSVVLDAACKECAKWPEQIGVSVNLSAKDFRSSDVVNKVRSALQAADISPNRLEIEVTETALLNDTEATIAYIRTLKGLGVRIALDDFGTGYSSLSYLHTLPLDKVKIDGSFVANLKEGQRSLYLLQGVVDLSRKLGLAVTVEGVERFDQLKLLESFVKPDLLQGFLFGPALTASGIETMAEMKQPVVTKARAGRNRLSL
ncbi:bifunctional diguanylate cyclase/phosphodiesterase [Nitratireductor sp. ZSWI3]|uniref:putative bifunctional diguanylate cyclase/phosphodiesterase n=1 Tax=Nitratireductor sp. ZSWI3 TaxID=2966359 RepID=UPI00214F6558|nr:EAL domain-containing protein [Nitratireductor sp. ZSWI3]MCR4264929.1 EAL domain-containing protein [Nitratireductor sp. ZSWI3]